MTQAQEVAVSGRGTVRLNSAASYSARCAYRVECPAAARPLSNERALVLSTPDRDLTLLAGSRALVTGATGFTGSLLTRKLVRAGATVVAIARSSSNTEPLHDVPIQWVRGDLSHDETVQRAVAGVQYVFNVAAAYREAKLAGETYYRVHVVGTQLLARAALAQPSLKRFVHVSTVGVHSHIAHPPADEDCPMNPADIYQQTKATGEVWIRDFAASNGLPLTVVRPAAIYGPGDKRLFKLFRAVARRWVPALGRGNHLYHLIHVDDLTDFLLLVATHPKAVGEVFICGSESARTYREIVGIIAATYGVRVRFIRLPATPVYLVSALCELLCRPLGIEPPLYRRRVAFFTKDRSFNTSKMRNLVGFAPRHSDDAGLRDTAQWYREQGWIVV